MFIMIAVLIALLFSWASNLGVFFVDSPDRTTRILLAVLQVSLFTIGLVILHGV